MCGMELVKLKNGAEESDKAVAVITISLEHLFTTMPVLAYDLVMKCRDADYRLFGNTAVLLHERGLMDTSGHVHETIRNVVLSAVIGDGVEMTLTNPVKAA